MQKSFNFAGRNYSPTFLADDFSSPTSRDSPASCNSSVSSSSGGLGDEADYPANSASHNQVVGWPPIGTCRRKNFVSISRVANSDIKAATHKEISQSCSSSTGRKGVGGNDDERKAIHACKSRFVKVNMDGDPIGRKVDLHSHVSYEALGLFLETMFHKPTLSFNASTNGMFSKLLDGSSEFALIYEDEDGDWMLVGDVPWGMFLRTAKRLRIMKTMDACGPGDSVNAEPMLLQQINSTVPL